MQFGVWLHPAAPVDDLVDAIVRLDSAGVDEVWVADEGVARDPFVVLAAAAVRTERIRLGVGITSPLLRHPGAVAATAMTIDELSVGRMMLGWGVGGHESLGPFGLSTAHPLRTVREAMLLARSVFHGTAGPDYSPPTHASPPRSIPQFVGARGPRLNRLASELADGVFLSGFVPSHIDAAISAAHGIRPIAIHLYASVRYTTPGDPTAFAGAPDVIAANLVELANRHRPEVLGIALVDGDPLFVMTKSAIHTLDEVRRGLGD